jgi:hypothetical protein
MKADEFRKIALGLAGTSESAHQGHADFRVNGRIFATLGYPDDDYGAVMLTPEDQREYLRAHPKVFAPAKGAWGRSGSTVVKLEQARPSLVRKAMAAAWQKRVA